MYVPTSFAESDQTKLHDFIRQNSFGLLISQVDYLPFASHLPILLEPDTGPCGVLVSHMACANPQWHELDGQTVLAVFSGPHAYISPTWYEADNVVPTWNYTAVHVYGVVRVIHDRDSVLKIVEDSVAVYESTMPHPWSLDLRSSSIEQLLKQIVGFRIQIEKIEGKFKLNQNHPEERQERVIRALEDRGGENANSIAQMMRERIK